MAPDKRRADNKQTHSVCGNSIPMTISSFLAMAAFSLAICSREYNIKSTPTTIKQKLNNNERANEGAKAAAPSACKIPNSNAPFPAHASPRNLARIN